MKKNASSSSWTVRARAGCCHRSTRPASTGASATGVNHLLDCRAASPHPYSASLLEVSQKSACRKTQTSMRMSAPGLEERLHSGSRVPPTSGGGLPGLQSHDARTASAFAFNNPLRATSGTGGTGMKGHKGDKAELQQLSGSNPIHPLLSDYRSEASSWWVRNNVVQRSFVVTCVVLSLLLASMVAYEVRAVVAESAMRDGTDEANPQFNEAGCHWTQIRLPNSLSGSDVSVQVNLRQPSARYEEIHNFSEIGKDYSYCFVVFTQGSTAVSASSLADTSEEAIVKPTKQAGVYILLFKSQLSSLDAHATINIHFARKQAMSGLPWFNPSPITGWGAVTANQDSDDLRCWKECIEYDSQCDTDISSSGLRRSLLSQYGWQQMIKDKECGAITTCADQRTVHNCGWCQTGTKLTAGRGIQCRRDEMLPDMNCIPTEPCEGFWTWQSADCPMVGNGICILKVVCTRYKKTCIGYHDMAN
eukprot:jgi/Tetstr1/441597/TSEL_029825.t1